jgi:hypothetical protein
VRLERLEVLAGLVRLVRNSKGATRDYGIPGPLSIAVLAPNATEPPKGCTWTRPASTPGASTRTYKYGGCASCGRCLVALDFKCGAAYRVRVQAKGRGKTLLASEWSQDLEWKATCSGDAGVACYK